MPLASPNDPYIDGSGKVVEQTSASENVSNDKALRETERTVLPRFAAIATHKNLALDNLPEPSHQQQTVIAAIVGLRLMGVSEVDIAEIVDTPLGNVKRVINLRATQISFERIFQNMIATNSDAVQGRIAAYAGRAVDTVVAMMDNEDTRDDVRLKAAQDVLDRSGTNADQFFGGATQNERADEELRIVIMDESGEKEKVKVEVKR